MRKLTASVAICTLLAAAPAPAQEQTQGADADVYRSELPETHAGFDLPQVDAQSLDFDDSDLRSLAAQSAAAQQLGNIAAAKNTSGVARDLGDAMILLHDGILRRIAPDGQQADLRIAQEAQEAIAELDTLNEEAAGMAFASWIESAYPEMIQAWQQAEGQDGLEELSQTVVPLLEQQLAVAEEIVAAEGALDAADSAAVANLNLGGPDNLGTSGSDGPTGTEG